MLDAIPRRNFDQSCSGARMQLSGNSRRFYRAIPGRTSVVLFAHRGGLGAGRGGLHEPYENTPRQFNSVAKAVSRLARRAPR